MDRLTYKYDDKWCISGINGKLISDKHANYWGEAIDRLATYENTELYPEAFKQCAKMLGDINILQFYEWLKANSENRLVVLPCKVGQKLYTVCCHGIRNYRIHEGTLCEIKMIDDSGFSFYEQRLDGWCYEVNIEEIGKTIFLHREEAELKITELISN